MRVCTHARRVRQTRAVQGAHARTDARAARVSRRAPRERRCQTLTVVSQTLFVQCTFNCRYTGVTARKEDCILGGVAISRAGGDCVLKRPNAPSEVSNADFTWFAETTNPVFTPKRTFRTDRTRSTSYECGKLDQQ